MSSSFSEDQLQLEDTLEDRGTDDVLDEGMSPPERPSRPTARGETARDDAAGESLDDRLEQEEPDPVAAIDHTAQAQADEIVGADDLADEVGIDGGAASAEESAVHTVDEDGV